MGKVVRICCYRNVKVTEGEKMCRKLVLDIRKKKKNVEDMPDRAKEILEYFNIKDFSEGVPIIDILKKMGFKIFQSNLEPDGLSAYIAVDPKFEEVFESNKITCVHAKDNIGHKRFALAHELAHYLFDFDEDRSLYYYDTYFANGSIDKFEEERANAFAANLLMPADIFWKKYKEFEALQSKAEIVSALSRYFRVSATAVMKRFPEVGIEGYTTLEK